MFEEFQRLPRYLRAPELLDSIQNYDESVDIWSLGCIIFNMVTGIPPFYDSDEDKMYCMIRMGKYEGQIGDYDKNSSEDLKSLISKMICIDPKDRISSEDLFQDKWITSANQRHKYLSKAIVSIIY